MGAGSCRLSLLTALELTAQRPSNTSPLGGISLQRPLGTDEIVAMDYTHSFHLQGGEKL